METNGEIDMKGINILLVDDNKNFLVAFKFILNNIESKPGINEIFTAMNGKECLAIVEKEKIDIAFIDVDMSDMDGIEVTKQIVKNNRTIKIVAISFHNEAEYIRRMLSAGAVNYIKKDSLNVEIIMNELKLISIESNES